MLWGGGGGKGGISRRHIEVCIFSYFSKKIIFSISNKGDNLHEMPKTTIFSISSKFSRKETIYIKCERLSILSFFFFFFFENKKKTSSHCRLLK